MKIKFSLTALALLLSITFLSCRKHTEGKTSYKTVDIALDMNKAYQYNFGSLASHLTITKQSQAFLTSEIDNVVDAAVFNYTPKANFTGTDVIEITSCAAHTGHHNMNAGSPPPNGNGNCQHACGNQNCSHSHNCTGHHDCHNHDKTVYTFRFTVNSTTPATITRVSSLSVNNQQ